MLFFFILFLFFAIPIASLIFFIVSLIRYSAAQTKKQRFPDSISEKRIHTLKILRNVSGIIFLVLLVVIAELIMLLNHGLVFM